MPREILFRGYNGGPVIQGEVLGTNVISDTTAGRKEIVYLSPQTLEANARLQHVVKPHQGWSGQEYVAFRETTKGKVSTNKLPPGVCP